MGAASLFSGSAHAATKEQGGVRKLGYDGKPTDGTGFITPLIIHKGVIYIAGQGAHSRNPQEQFPNDVETHTTKVLDNVKDLSRSRWRNRGQHSAAHRFLNKD